MFKEVFLSGRENCSPKSYLGFDFDALFDLFAESNTCFRASLWEFVIWSDGNGEL